MSSKDKEIIKELLNQLQKAIESGDNTFCINDQTLPSLYLWCKYMEYLQKVLFQFNDKKQEDIQSFASIFDFLQLDDMHVDAHQPIETSKKILDSYIKSIQTKLDSAV